MADFTVYGTLGSPYLRAVLAALLEKSQPYRLMPIAFGQHLGPEHLERHPFGRVPVLDHGDFRLYETQAILRYLDVVIPAPALRPGDPRRIARMDQIMGIVDWYLFPRVTMGIAFERTVKPFLRQPVDEAAIAATMPKARVCIQEFERLLGDQEFLAGDALTLADLLAAPQLAAIAITPEGAELLAETRLAHWLVRMEARPSMKATTRVQLLQTE